MSEQQKEKLVWDELVSFKRFPKGEDGAVGKPKVLTLMSVSDGSFAVSMSDEKGRIVMKLSIPEALQLSLAVIKGYFEK
jgi:hypothetical protein